MLCQDQEWPTVTASSALNPSQHQAQDIFIASFMRVFSPGSIWRGYNSNGWCIFSRPPVQGQSLRAHLQRVTGEKDELSGANASIKTTPNTLQQRLFEERELLLQEANSFCCSRLRACSVHTGEISQGSWGHGRQDDLTPPNTMSGSSPRPKGGAILPILRKFLSYFPSQHYLRTSFQCFLFPPTIHWAQHAAIDSVGLPNTTAEVGEFHQQRNIFTLIYSTLQTFGKRINTPCTYWALHTARAQSRESHQHSSEHKWLITQPKGKLNGRFTHSASTAEESLATSPSATPSSSSATNNTPASAEGLQLASFCHKPGLDLSNIS